MVLSYTVDAVERAHAGCAGDMRTEKYGGCTQVVVLVLGYSCMMGASLIKVGQSSRTREHGGGSRADILQAGSTDSH